MRHKTWLRSVWKFWQNRSSFICRLEHMLNLETMYSMNEAWTAGLLFDIGKSQSNLSLCMTNVSVMYRLYTYLLSICSVHVLAQHEPIDDCKLQYVSLHLQQRYISRQFIIVHQANWEIRGLGPHRLADRFISPWSCPGMCSQSGLTSTTTRPGEGRGVWRRTTCLASNYL